MEIIHGPWHNFINPNVINDLYCDEKVVWAATEGGAVEWNLETKVPKVYTIFDGLTDNFVLSVAKDAQGIVWLGTYGGGLCGYEKTFKTFDERDGLPGNHIKVILPTDGGIWLGTDRGLCFFDGRKFSKTYLKGHYVNSLLLCEYGFFVGTQNNGLYHSLSINELQLVPATMMEKTSINSLALNPKKELCVGTEKGLAILNVQTLRQKALLFEGTYITSITFCNGKSYLGTAAGSQKDSHGNLWLGKKGAGIKVFSEGNITNITSINGLVHDTVRVIKGSHGQIFVGTDEGITILNSGNLVVEEKTILTNRILSIDVSPDDSIAVGTARRGIGILKKGHWDFFFDSNYGASNNAQSVTYDNNGKLWCGTAGGIFLFDTEFKKINPPVEISQPLYISKVFCDSKGRLWFGSRGQGVLLLDSGGWQQFSSKSLPDWKCNTVRAISEDERGRIWVGTTGGGCQIYDGKKWSQLSVINGLISPNVYAIAKDRENRIWIGTDQGISIHNGNTFTNIIMGPRHLFSRLKHIARDDGLMVLLNHLKHCKWLWATAIAGRQIWDIASDSFGNTWIACNGGVTKFDTKFEIMTTKEGLCDHNVRSIAIERDKVWMGTLGGLSCYHMSYENAEKN